MAKRIVSGIFILTALGALGVILAGAMTSGEQLIVRFLTAVTVAALALYVISDLRLQNEQEELPTERTGSLAGPSPRQSATAVMATVTGPHRTGRTSRRNRVEPLPVASNFEAIQPVTAPSRSVAVVDPTETVTGSRIVPPSPGSTERTVPPQPPTGHSAVKHTPAVAPLSEPMVPLRPLDQEPADESPAEFPPMPADESAEPLPPMPPDESPEPLPPMPADESPAPLPPMPPDEWATEPARGSVIATTSYTYSGPLDSVGVEWPPKPPDGDAGGVPADADDPAQARSAVDTPTAEIPALSDLSTFDTDGGSLLTMFTPEPGGTDRDGDPAAETATSGPFLFAVDTAEVTTGSSEQTETIDSADPSDPDVPMQDDASTETTGTWQETEDRTGEVGDHTEPADAAGSATDIGDHTEPADAAGSATEVGDIMETTSGDDPPPALPTPASRQIEAAHYATPIRPDVLDLRDPAEPAKPSSAIAAALPNETKPSDKLTAAIRSGELQVINSLISQGMLSTNGPITDRDVRTMVYVAFTSNELRKLILAGGTPEGIRAGDLDLGEVELFDESRFAPPPKRLYPGPPGGPDGRQDPILDLVALEEDPVAPLTDSAADHDIDVGSDATTEPTLPTPTHLYRRSDIDSRIDR